MRRLRSALVTVLVLLAVALAPSAWTAAMWLVHHEGVDTARTAPVAMVLGASVQNGNPSPFLAGRLDVALDLYRSGTVSAILVSGDNKDTDYDEPTVMKQYLTDRGVPASQIVRDPAGYNTYDSCVRARDVYGVTRLIVVTQDYHLPRTIATCRAVGLDATGVADTTARQYRDTWWWGVAREAAANWKLLYDLVTDRQPTASAYDPSLQEAVERGR